MASTAAKSNLAAVLHGPADLRLEKRSIPTPGPDEVTLRIQATGLCGSDLHYYLHGRNGDFSLEHPMCLGHESVGIVIALGDDVGARTQDGVSALHVGTRVVVEPGRNCTTCELCRKGRYNLCPTLRFASSAKTKPHLDGTLQRYFSWPARLCHALPAPISDRQAALIEPLSVVLQAFERARVDCEQRILVVGAGAVGLLACIAAKALGVPFVAAADIDDERLKFGEANGWIDRTNCIPKEQSSAATFDEDSDAKRMERTRLSTETMLLSFDRQPHVADRLPLTPKGFDLVFECTGVPSCIQSSIFAAKTGGKVVLIGMGHPIVTLPLGQAALREVDILGVFRYANMFPKAIRLLSQQDVGAIATIERLISHTFPLERAGDAFRTLQHGQSDDGKRVVKVLVTDEESIGNSPGDRRT